MRKSLSLAALAAVSALALSPASAQEKVLRIGMTASDIPTTTGMPNNGFDYKGYAADNFARLVASLAAIHQRFG